MSFSLGDPVQIEREFLPDYLKKEADQSTAFWLCREWLLEYAVRRKYTWMYHSSYWYKHRVEEMSVEQGKRCYVRHGTFTAAALSLGFRARIVPGQQKRKLENRLFYFNLGIRKNAALKAS